MGVEDKNPANQRNEKKKRRRKISRMGAGAFVNLINSGKHRGASNGGSLPTI